MELVLLGSAAAIGYFMSKQDDGPNSAETESSPGMPTPMGSVTHQTGFPTTPYRTLQFVSRDYAADPRVPDPLPNVINFSHNMPDTDDRIPHNYPGPPLENRAGYAALTPLQKAFMTRGYADGPSDGSFGPQDVTNAVGGTDGVLPWIGRTAQTPMMIDPLDSNSFKPPKSTVAEADLHAAPERGWNVNGNPNTWSTSYVRASNVDPYTKTRSATGQFNNYWPGQLSAEAQAAGVNGCGNIVTSDTTKDYGFSNGEKFTLRTGGFHYGMQRPFREPPSQRQQQYFRIGNPSNAVGRFQSEWAQGTGPLGELRDNKNASVREYGWDNGGYEPLPTAGLTATRIGAHESVVLQNSNRSGRGPYVGLDGETGGDSQCAQYDAGLPTETPWAGPMGPAGFSQEALRPFAEQRDVKPNKTTQFPLGSGFQFGVTEQKGPNDTNPVQLRPTNQPTYTANRNSINDPSPFYPSGPPAIYNTEEWLDPVNLKQIGTDYAVDLGCNNSVPESHQYWTNGKGMVAKNRCGQSESLIDGVMRPGGASIGFNETADSWGAERVNPFVLRETLKDFAPTLMQYAHHPPNSTRTMAMQYGNLPACENRKVTPQITMDIDPALLQAYQSCPYTMPIASHA